MAAEENKFPRRTSISPAQNAVGRVTLAPATHTTVVTTTTTTTTSFPPFTLNVPQDLKSRDPEVYPLAAISTPDYLKRLSFSVGDQTAYFEEVEDAEHIMKKVSEFAEMHHHKFRHLSRFEFLSNSL